MYEKGTMTQAEYDAIASFLDDAAALIRSHPTKTPLIAGIRNAITRKTNGLQGTAVRADPLHALWARDPLRRDVPR
jgi:hypothetical protein